MFESFIELSFCLFVEMYKSYKFELNQINMLIITMSTRQHNNNGFMQNDFMLMNYLKMIFVANLKFILILFPAISSKFCIPDVSMGFKIVPF